MSHIIIPRFPLQGSLYYYLIKRWLQAMTHKARDIIISELVIMLPPRCCPPLAGGNKGPEDLSVLLYGEEPVPRAPPPGTVFSKVSAGSLCWSAGNQVSLFLWLTLISFCWQQSVARCPAAFRRLPTHAQSPWEEGVMSAYCTLWTRLDSKSLQSPGPPEALMLVSLYSSPHFRDQG